MVQLVQAKPLPLIPLPAHVGERDGTFEFSPATALFYDAALKDEVALFANDLKALTGKEPKFIQSNENKSGAGQISLRVDPSLFLPAEGYILEVMPNGVAITGKDAAGLYYGTRTFLQLLPAQGAEAWKDAAPEKVPALLVKDSPRFSWRGMHLDVGRHYFPAKDIKGFIDWLAFHKINVMHWHLSEDQGWRVEIKKYPKLTEVGGFRDSTPPYGNRGGSDGKRYGGFYTQEEIKEIVAYAEARHITIVPEIDMPGHMAAAIAAYPQFGNTDIQGYNPKVVTNWGVYHYTLSPTEETFQFVDDVLTEICALFPSPYIHIGGDEAPKNQWDNSPRVRELMKEKGLKNSHDVQSYFIKRVEKMLEAKGRKLIGWDEIREGGLAPSATVMSWRGEQGGIDSAKEGHDVVMASNSHLYFDYYQFPANQELAKGVEYECIGGHLPIEKVYSYDPVPKALNEEEARHILGVQAQLWTEYMHDWKKVEYMAFPRIAALSEISWTALDRKNYDDFANRLSQFVSFYGGKGVNHAPFVAPAKRETKDGSSVTSSIDSHANNWPELTFDGRDDTYFWGNRPLKENDHLTLKLNSPLAADTSISIRTGGSGNDRGDQLEAGVLEVSTDGTTWKEVATFKEGSASGAAPASTSSIRLRVTKPQVNWLKVQEIKLGAK